MSGFKIKGLRWWMISLIMVGSMINFLTRSTLGNTASTLKANLGIDEQHYSWVLNAFQLTVMLQPIAGYVLDVIGLRIGFAFFATVWSVANMCHTFAHGWQTLAGLRAVMGFAEGSANPAGMKTVAEWFPAKERGFAGGLFNIGASVGSMVAAPLVAWCLKYHHWQTAFVISGGIGLGWVLLWLMCYRPRTRHPALTEAEKDYIVAGQEKYLEGGTTRPSVWAILQQRNFWGIALPRFLADPMWTTLTSWMPLYLLEVRHLDLKQFALFAWLPFLGADLGCMFGGVVVAALQKRGVGLINARRSAFTLGACLMTGMLFVGFVHSPYAAIALLSLGGFAHQTLSVTVITMSSDLFKRSEVATVAGMAGTCGNAGVLGYNFLIGLLVVTIGYTPFFIGVVVLDLIGAAVLWAFVKERNTVVAAG